MRLAVDWLTAAALVTLPWSTSATSILLGLWILAFLSTLDWYEGFRRLREPVIALPAALCAFAVIGMLWTNAPWSDRIAGLSPFLKLWVLAWLIIHFGHSTNGRRVIFAFLGSALVSVSYSWLCYFFPVLSWSQGFRGIPVLDHIYLGVIYALTACGLTYACLQLIRDGRYALAGGAIFWIALLVANIAFVATSRTGLLILLLLMPLVVLRNLKRSYALGAIAAFILAIALTAAFSTHLQKRTAELWTGTTTSIDKAETSENLRLTYWSRAITVMRETKFLGTGTGGTRNAFGGAPGQYEIRGGVANNPHNQTLAVGTQLGILGIVLLWGMWFAHLINARGERWEAQLCLLVVLQNIIASVFNSHISDFTGGWLYVLLVGVLGGTLWRQVRPEAAQADVEKFSAIPSRVRA